jgi:hypothetical protein
MSPETCTLAFKNPEFPQEAQMKHLAASFVLLCPLVAFSAEIPDAALAQSKNITLPAHPSVAEMEAKSKLQVLSGQDPDARAFASATLPTLEAHLKKIQAIAANAGASAE